MRTIARWIPLIATAAALFALSTTVPRGSSSKPELAPPPSLRLDRLGFEPNRGQAGAGVRFLAWDPGFRAELRVTGAQISWRPARDAAPVRLGIRLAGGNPTPAATAQEELPTRSHHFVGNDPTRWRISIPHYARVEYADVYPGVDVVFHREPGALRYDFVVGPGADPSTIALEFDGAHGLQVDEDGDLVLATGAGEVRQRRPTIYQEEGGRRRPVEGRYVLRGPNRVGVEVAAYDRSEALVIDPTLVYSTYLGDVRGDRGYAVAVDATGAAYVAGGFQWGDNTHFDVFVAKFDPTGRTLLWRAQIGGQFNEEAAGIALDSAGNVHITGWTGSFPSDPPGRPEYPRTPDALQPGFGGGSNDAFVTVLSPEGTIVYSTFFGGSGDDQGRGIALDAAGDAYLTGFTASPDFPMAVPFQAVSGGGYDAYVARMNGDKSALVYSSYLGGAGDDRALRLALDGTGHAYVAGTTSSADFPTMEPLQARFGGGASDAFVAKVLPDGTGVVYSTYLGGSGADQGRDVAVDAAAQAYVAGTTDSSDFPMANPLEGVLSAPPNADAFLAKLESSGAGLVYSTYLGAKGGSGVAVDAGQNAYVTGGGVLSAKLDPTGSTLLDAFWALGGSAIAVDGSGHAYVTGGTFSPMLPTKDAYQPRNGGMFSARGRDDAFLVKISDVPAAPPAIEENDGQVSYTGTWTVDEAPGHSGGRAVFSDETGASVTFTFTGTAVQLVGRREESSGFATVTTESTSLWGSVDTYASPAQEQALILSISGLTAGTHTLTVSVSGSHNARSQGNRVWIDGFTVTPPPSPSFTLTVTRESLLLGSGTVTSSPPRIDCGATCSASYDSATVVTLTATPALGSVFVGWSGACSGILDPSCTVTMTADTGVTATFVGVLPQLLTGISSVGRLAR